ncbi:penicillin-binding transpeptidase domain-containing protein [Imperialibacter roseus]|uniref:Penicillin-binding transpeptidase domain-containing protein n=1 Tax=Imperialibacter roseus TaxID=1324217 RepID=A0ABZ0IRM6_9BACT|nr:penicillin-binding transpeptidase domain-containing protein [Imperialibacter roseus]WOK06247.1 penicillin-binding transpeptidase domain-containing protein [Imperialibacter roseus]|tara:strand:+ start:7755 stop:9587 length:1833 start_codon:yes stop_codon:yes gene_type:complete
MNDSRKLYIQTGMVLVSVILLVRLFIIQIVDTSYKSAADSNIIQKVIEYPYRGEVYDRNGKLLVYNSPVYDILGVPKEIENLDTAKFCRLFNISKADLIDRLNAARKYSPIKASKIVNLLSPEEFAKTQDYLIDFPGFYVSARTVRGYTTKSAANALGYTGEISKRQLDADRTGYYSQGDHIGISGLELSYERELRGKRGVKYKLVNVRGVDKGSFKNGLYDTLSIPGENITTTLDIELQQYAEKLLAGKVGSIVAIEPATGEILVFVSGPSYDPAVLSGRDFGANFTKLSQDSLVPLFNRPLMAMYRPGSVFKIMQAMIGLQEGVITPNTVIACNQSVIGCHYHGPSENLLGAITMSCNPYFHQVLKRVVNQDVSRDTYEDTRIGLEKWRGRVANFGFGSTLGIDLPNEKGGMVPNVAYYDRAYNNQPWKYSNIYSIAIGEGENLVVPLQMANFTATVANRGYYYTPHLVKAISDTGKPRPEYEVQHHTGINPEYFDIAVEAMHNVVEHGTGQYRAKLDDIVVCGKTGTVQNANSPDHSAFIAFAPMDNPRIAVSVYVENAGQGARAAAAISGLIIEKYLKGEKAKLRMEPYVLKGDFLDADEKAKFNL